MKKVVKFVKLEMSLNSLDESGEDLENNDPHSTKVSLEINSDYGCSVDTSLVTDFMNAIVDVANKERTEGTFPDSEKKILTESYDTYGGTGGMSTLDDDYDY